MHAPIGHSSLIAKIELIVSTLLCSNECNNIVCPQEPQCGPWVLGRFMFRQVSPNEGKPSPEPDHRRDVLFEVHTEHFPLFWVQPFDESNKETHPPARLPTRTERERHNYKGFWSSQATMSDPR